MLNPALTPAASWTAVGGGFSANASSAAGGSTAVATWTTTVTKNEVGFQGGLEVAATWVPPASGGATNATYTITNSTTGTVLATVPVDQTLAPEGVASGVGVFQDLGSFTTSTGTSRGSNLLFVGDTLTITLNANSANGTVVADAIGLGRRKPPAAAKARSNRKRSPTPRNRAAP